MTLSEALAVAETLELARNLRNVWNLFLPNHPEYWERDDNLCACEFQTCHPLVNTMASRWRLVCESSSPLQLKMTFCQVPHEPKPTHCHATIQPQLTATCMYGSNHCSTSLLDFTGLVIHAFVREYHVDIWYIYIYTRTYSSIIIYHTQLPTSFQKNASTQGPLLPLVKPLLSLVFWGQVSYPCSRKSTNGVHRALGRCIQVHPSRGDQWSPHGWAGVTMWPHFSRFLESETRPVGCIFRWQMCWFYFQDRNLID